MFDTVMKAATSFAADFSRDPRQEKLSTETDSTKRIELIGSVSEFHERTNILLPGSKVIVKGTFSSYLPIFCGEVAIKRNFYSELRKNIKQHQEKTVEYLLSLIAGQMIIHPRCGNDSAYIPCALYEFTVRNSVLVLIHKDIYAQILRIMQKESENPNFAEVRITGVVDVIDNTFVQCLEDVLHDTAINQIVDRSQLQSLAKTRIIRLQNDDDWLFQYGGTPRFLYGEVWLSIQRGQEKRLITRFLNLSHYNEMLEQLDDMVIECQQQFKDWNIVGSHCHYPISS